MSGLRVTRQSLFLAFVAMGVVCGLLMGSLGNALAASSLSASGPAAKTPATDNTLVVLVDQLSAPARVYGVWAVQRSVTGSMGWLPLYPAPLQDSAVQLELSNLEMSALLSLAPVQQAGIEFSGYFVIDPLAVDALYAVTGLTPAELGTLQQAQLIQHACAMPWQAEHLETWVALIPQHLHSNWSVFELITRWDRWAQSGFTVQCNVNWAG